MTVSDWMRVPKVRIFTRGKERVVDPTSTPATIGFYEFSLARVKRRGPIEKQPEIWGDWSSHMGGLFSIGHAGQRHDAGGRPFVTSLD